MPNVSASGEELLDKLAQVCCYRTETDPLMGKHWVTKPPGHDGDHFIMRGGAYDE